MFYLPLLGLLVANNFKSLSKKRVPLEGDNKAVEQK